jgi:recombination protein RecA
MAQRKKKTKEKEEKKVLSEKDQAFELAMAAIKKTHGAGAVITKEQDFPDIDRFSSGCSSLDVALGGGWPRGRILEVFGPESSGKTTLCLHAIAEMHKLGERAAFIDLEHALDMNYARALGVQDDLFILSQPDSAEQGLDIVETLVRSRAVGLIVIDSVAALVPRAEIEGEMGDQQMGLAARLMGKAMRKLAGIAAKSDCSIIFINQIRMKIGVMFGNPETTTGGNALKFFASQRVEVRRKGGIKEGAGDNAEYVANETRAKVVKNKVSPPFKEATFLIRYGEGIDSYTDMLRVAVSKGIVTQAGSWYSFGDQRLGQGEGNIVTILRSDRDLHRAILEQLRSS